MLIICDGCGIIFAELVENVTLLEVSNILNRLKELDKVQEVLYKLIWVLYLFCLKNVFSVKVVFFWQSISEECVLFTNLLL